MKQDINKATNQTPQDRSLVDTVLCCIFYVLACAYIPIAMYMPMHELASAVLALGVSVAGILILFRIARTFSAIASYAIILGILILFGGTLLPIGLFSAFVTATCVFAHATLNKKAPIIWGIPLIPLAVAILIFRSPSAAVLSLATLPCSLLLAYSIKHRIERVGSVCRLSLGICIFVIALFCATVWTVYGELTLASSRALIESLRNYTVLLFDSAAAELGSAIGIDTATSDVKNLVDVTVASMFNLLPALIITASNIVAYVIHSLFLSVSFTSDEEKKEAVPMIILNMSLASAIVYLCSFVLSFALSSESVALYGTAAENMLLILAPGLILTTLGVIRGISAKKGPSCLGTLLYFAVIFLLISFSAFAIIAVSFAGAILIISAHIAKRKSDKAQ